MPANRAQQGRLAMLNSLLVRLAILLAILVAAAATAVAVLIFATSSPPTLSRTVASPNAQIRVLARGQQDPGIQQTGLTYQDAMHPKNANPTCDAHGHWNLIVNPQDVVGHPYAAAPALEDWTQASRAIATAMTICSSQVVLTWYGHDPARPASDIWTADLPVAQATGTNGAELRSYALRHARQV